MLTISYVLNCSVLKEDLMGRQRDKEIQRERQKEIQKDRQKETERDTERLPFSTRRAEIFRKISNLSLSTKANNSYGEDLSGVVRASPECR